MREIAGLLASGEAIDQCRLEKLLRLHNRRTHDAMRTVSKRRLLSFYLKERSEDTSFYRSLKVDEALHATLVSLLRAKPRRTASGVATITVLTKPWPCGGRCLYCPNDVRMPKSYLSDEPACQRAERCFFDPYLQTCARLRVLRDMGHNIDKVELIVLGGTFSDYPEEYQDWYVKELFRALNEFGTDACEESQGERRAFYESCGIHSDPGLLEAQCALAQRLVDEGRASYNDVVSTANSQNAWMAAQVVQRCTFAEVEEQQRINVDAPRRNVGLVVETRPELLTRKHAERLRRLGCTKIQIGIQSLNPEVLAVNTRTTTVGAVADAFAVLREFGFKTHVHFMANLPGSSPEMDKAGYEMLVSDERFKPDEVKLYPCALVGSSRLMEAYEAGEWRPYGESELIDVLSHCVKATPPYTRISRMIRDISSKDIVVGNRKTNLRQMVERELDGLSVQEMRMREIATSEQPVDDLMLDAVEYKTTDTREVFLQYVTCANRLAAFLRLSLPANLKTPAMIREVHVYGKVSRLHEQREGTQHAGLGRSLVERACAIASGDGRDSIKVISAVGTRGYYSSLGFQDAGLYQQKHL